MAQHPEPPTAHDLPHPQRAEVGPTHHHERMSGQAWALFAAMSLIWGLPYLFIKIAVEQIPPAGLVLARTGLALIVLLPMAVRSGALGAALRH